MTPNEHESMEIVLRSTLLEGLQQVREWFFEKKGPFLRSIFDQVGFVDKGEAMDIHLIPPYSLSFRTHYPVRGQDPLLEKVKEEVRREIKRDYGSLDSEYLRPLPVNALLFLLEKFGGSIPSAEDESVPLFDTYKIRAAREVIELNRKERGHGPGVLVISLDLSGIQRFIYNIASRGALKNLRSRSFFIELLANHAISRVLDAFSLHPVNVLMNGGGNVNILSSKPADHAELLDRIDYGLNAWLSEEFNGRLNVVITAVELSDQEIGKDVSGVLKKISQESFRKKNRKFDALIRRGEFVFVSEEDPSAQECEICHRDYTPKKRKETDAEEAPRCPFCERLTRLGNLIPKVKYIYKSDSDGHHCLPIEDAYYLLSDTKLSRPCAWVVFDDSKDFLGALDTSATPLFSKTYIASTAMLPKEVQQAIDEEKADLKARWEVTEDPQEKRLLKEDLDSYSDEYPAMMEHLADASQGTKLIGALRMDADNMGKILQKGFYGNATLERISAFSRNINYFFKLHLDSLCRDDALHRNGKNRMVHVIYAGGDDLFALGAWNDIAELSLDIGEAFRAYTCDNMDLGLSGGFTLHKSKFPVSKMAALSLMALNCSKENCQPCWFCRQDWMGCPLFRDGACLRKDSLTPFFVESKAALKHRLDQEHTRKYLSEPSRLKLSFKRKRFDTKSHSLTDELNDYVVEPLKLFTALQRSGFLHRILSMLEVWYPDGVLYLPRISWFLQKHKQQLAKIIEEEAGASMHDRYDQHVHLGGPVMLSALHVPLSWAILSMKEGERKDES